MYLKVENALCLLSKSSKKLKKKNVVHIYQLCDMILCFRLLLLYLKHLKMSNHSNNVGG